MKKLFTLFILTLAFMTNARAWEPKIKETHWFGVYEYADYWNDDFDEKTINWSGNYIESIVIVKTHTGQQGNKQAPKTSFYSWLDHKLRFSVGSTGSWDLRRENVNQYHQGYDGRDHYDWDGMGLCNTSNDYDFFYIHDLEVDDEISIEYYVDKYNTPTDYIFVYDTGNVSGALEGLNHGNNIASKQTYKVTSAGEVHFNVGKGIIIRSVTINHANYQASDFKVDKVSDVSSITGSYDSYLANQGISAGDPRRQFGSLGYSYSFKGPGVLEDKRGAAPYITMKFGSDNDMTFVRNLGNGILGASSIIDASNNLNPATNNYDYLQYRLTYKEYNNTNNKYTEDEIRNTTVELIGKEWSTFTAQHDYTVDASSAGTNNSNNQLVIYGDLFDTIWPLCGNFFYFFPEVDGLLQIDYYCEGAYETPAFWYKQRENGTYPGIGEQPKVQHVGTTNDQTNGSNNYSLRVNVEKGGVYYLCSLPTNMSHERPILRLKSYTFIPKFSVAPLYKVVKNTEVDNSSVEIKHVAEIKGGPYADLSGQTYPTDHVYQNSEYSYELTGTFTRNKMSEPRVKCLGNVVSAKAKVEYDATTKQQWLSFSDIVFRSGTNADGEAYNPGGAVVAHVENGVGQASFVLTIAYDAADAKWGKKDGKDTRVAATSGGKEVKRWDFYSGKGDYNASGVINDSWDLGKYGSLENYGKDDKTMYRDNQSGWEGKSKLFKETNKADLLTTDWEYDYVDVPNQKEPIFKSIYDMEADNADMIHETAGLVFFTEPNELGIWNENPTADGSFQDRYIGLMGGGKLIIPYLNANDRIVIKMGCFGNTDSGVETQQATLKITGAYDATGTKEIKEENGDYVIGGSGVENGNDTNGGSDITDKSQPWGEYHFVAKGGDFTLEVDKEKNKADLLKFYSIVIYRNAKDNNADILTENELLGDEEHLQILNTQDFTTAVDNVQLHMHYRGLNEETNYADKLVKTGNLTSGDIQLTSMTSNESLWYTFSVNAALPITPDKAKFGVFKARLGVQTMDESYVTDYADRMIPVGYRETKQYPYTWDLTDLKKYVSASIDANGTELEVADADADLRIWDEWNLRVTPEEWDGNIFVSGGQLYGGKTMIDETRGLGITHDNNNVASITSEVKDETDTKENGGLSVGSGEYGFIVPQLDKAQAVYVRAAKVGSTQKANYEESNGNPTYVYGQSQNASNVKSFTYHKTVSDGTGDEVFALVMPSNLTKKHDVRLNFQGYEVKKIAVSDDFKTVNRLGWATESRARVIDPALTSEMTGYPFKTYIVTDASYADKTVTLEEVNVTDTKVVMPIAEDGDNNAYIIRNMLLDEERKEGDIAAPGRVQILNNGFHLFVPDMHDYVADRQDGITNQKSVSAMGGNMLVSLLTSQTLNKKGSGNIYNYALTSQKNKVGDADNQTYLDEIGFYRIKDGTQSTGNLAYLPVDCSETQGTTGGGGAKMSIIFTSFDEPVENVETAIEVPFEEVFGGSNAVYYNLNGQKLNGKPTKSGLYIMNGKKILVK